MSSARVHSVAAQTCHRPQAHASFVVGACQCHSVASVVLRRGGRKGHAAGTRALPCGRPARARHTGVRVTVETHQTGARGDTAAQSLWHVWVRTSALAVAPGPPRSCPQTVTVNIAAAHDARLPVGLCLPTPTGSCACCFRGRSRASTSRRCRLPSVYVAVPGTCDGEAVQKLTYRHRSRVWTLQENITSYIKAARAFGQIPFEMFSTEDLASKKNLKSVISSLHSLGRKTQQTRPDIKPRLGIAVTKGVSCRGGGRRGSPPLVARLTHALLVP